MIRKTLLAGTALLLVASPAFADCTDEFKELQKTTSTTALSSELRRDINQLRSAARTLVRYKQSDTCEEVIGAIQDIVENRKEKKAEKRERKDELKRYNQATSVSELKGIVRVDDVQGMDIYNLKGEEIGVVESVTIDTDKGDIAYVVISHGGFLGMGEKMFAVPWKEFRMTNDRDALVLNVSEKTLENAPGFDEENWPNMGDPNWRNRIDSYYGKKNSG